MDAKLPIERVEEILQLATQGAKAVSEFMLKVSFTLFYYLVLVIIVPVLRSESEVGDGES